MIACPTWLTGIIRDRRLVRFEFASAGRIVFGPGVVKELPDLAAAFGKRAFVVTGKDRLRHAGIVGALEEKGLSCTLFQAGGEPSIELIRAGAALMRSAKSEFVIGIGGGSAIDAGKAIAAIAANAGDVLDYIEVIGRALPFERTPFPFIALPTTAGTGSEVTRNAVLGSQEHGVKASLRSASMLARVAVVDPELTVGLPPKLTASSGLDALTQLIEPFVSIRANPLADALCRDGLTRVARALPRAFENGADKEARAAMSYGSLLSGLALANAGLGVVHGFAAAVGGMFDVPHGSICAAILPHGMAVNLHALRERARESEALERYEQAARLIIGDPRATAEDGVVWISSLTQRLRAPRLGIWGIGEKDVAVIVERAARASSMKANPLPLSDSELAGIVRSAL
jgi:alcohol dehydrogenase class IV